MNRADMMKVRKYKYQLGLVTVSVFLNLLARNCIGFSDWFRKWVFPLFRSMMGRFSSLFPISVGELMLVIGFFMLLFWIVLTLAAVFGRYKKPFKHYSWFLSWVVAILCFVMTANCFVLYHCSDFETLYLSATKKEYTVSDLIRVRNQIIGRANALAPLMERDEKGELIAPENLEEQCIGEMKRMGEKYPLLSGYYTKPKTFLMSKFFSQQYMLGYYYPFSMEANYNGIMYIANQPATICHELSHIKGFMFEDDANFIGYLACVTSEDYFLQYCGYISVIDYLNQDLYESLGKSDQAYLSYVQCNDLVKKDNVFLTKETWEEVEKSAILKTETVQKASSKFLDTNLNLNGVEDGIASYGKVVELLLKYDDENGKCD